MSDTNESHEEQIARIIQGAVFPTFSDSEKADITAEFLQWREAAHELFGSEPNNEDD